MPMTSTNGNESPHASNPNDVYMGRGGLNNKLRIGTLYRKLVVQHYETYTKLESQYKRAYCIENVVQPIRNKGGRFWIPAAGESGRGRGRGGSCVTAWRVGSDAVIVPKVMQALRDCKKDLWDGGGGTGTNSSSNSSQDGTLGSSNGGKIPARLSPSPSERRTGTKWTASRPLLIAPRGAGQLSNTKRANGIGGSSIVPASPDPATARRPTHNLMLRPGTERSSAATTTNEPATPTYGPENDLKANSALENGHLNNDRTPTPVGSNSIVTSTATPPQAASPRKINLNEQGHLMNTVHRDTGVCALYHSLLVRFHPQMADIAEEDEAPFIWDNLMAPIQQAGGTFLVFPNKGQVIANVNHKTIQCIAHALRDSDYIYSDDVQTSIDPAAAGLVEGADNSHDQRTIETTAATETETGRPVLLHKATGGHRNSDRTNGSYDGSRNGMNDQGEIHSPVMEADVQSAGSSPLQSLDSGEVAAGRTIHSRSILKRATEGTTASRRQDDEGEPIESKSIEGEDNDQEFALARDMALQIIKEGPGKQIIDNRKRPASVLDDGEDENDGGGVDDDSGGDDSRSVNANTHQADSTSYCKTAKGKRSRATNLAQEDNGELAPRKSVILSSGRSTMDASKCTSRANVVTRSTSGSLPVQKKVRDDLPKPQLLPSARLRPSPKKRDNRGEVTPKPAARVLKRKPTGQIVKEKKPSHPAKRYPWELRYKELVEFVKETGHCNVPQRYEKNPSLGRFVKINRQYRVRKRRGGSSPLTAGREALLEAIGFAWEVKGQESVPLTWETQYRALEDFKEKHGHCDVPEGEMKYSKLSTWVKQMRYLRKVLRADDKHLRPLRECNIFSKARQDQLDELGFLWDDPVERGNNKQKTKTLKKVPGSATASDPVRVNKQGYEFKSWLHCFRELLKFYDTNGTLDIPYRRFPHNHPATILSKFVMDMRNQMSRKTTELDNELTDEREDMLNALGFDWNSATDASQQRMPTERFFEDRHIRESFLKMTKDLANNSNDSLYLDEETLLLRRWVANGFLCDDPVERRNDDMQKKKTLKKVPKSAIAPDPVRVIKQGYKSKSWLYCFRKMVIFYDTNGTLNIPYRSSPRNHPDTILTKFVIDMRNQKSRKTMELDNELTDEREDMLNALGFDWILATDTPQQWKERLFDVRRNCESFLETTRDLANNSNDSMSLDEETLLLRQWMAEFETRTERATSHEADVEQVGEQESGEGYESDDSLVF